MISRKDLISWDSILDAFGEKRHHSRFISLLHLMLRIGIRPDYVTILTIIHFCASLLRVEKVIEIHGYSISTESLFSATAPTVGNAILDAYSKCGNIEYTNKIFQNLSGKRNLVTHAGRIDEGLRIFDSIEKIHAMKPTMEQCACVVDLLARGGRVSEAYSFVTKMTIEANAYTSGTKFESSQKMSITPASKEIVGSSARLLNSLVSPRFYQHYKHNEEQFWKIQQNYTPFSTIDVGFVP
ncbi:putative pentatricopeptide repeat-containing protein At5g08490 [Lathyrus oleraceus]|uniref:putative pentatricopeptide repeat-containing protein At5g08490 n=1 Tax=Pisum sativum TaxID=3888 RepID=UPI0021CFCA57|nr:putative pentatricopeptide repeat-containing protein At5g08490 [Pisum sativum]